MKKLLVLLIALGACSTDEDPTPIVGTFSFTSVEFRGQFTVNASGAGTGTFEVDGVQYTAVNTQLRKGTTIYMYSENGAYVGLFDIDLPTSTYQEYRAGGLPSPFENRKRSDNLLITTP